MKTGLFCIAAGFAMLAGLGGAWWVVLGLRPGMEQDAIIGGLVVISALFGFFSLISVFMGFGIIGSRKATP